LTDPTGNPTWIDLAKAVLYDQISHWDATTCGGGLQWQIFSYNAGYTYKTPQAMVASSSLLPGMLDIRITKRMLPGPKKSMIGLEVSLSSMTNGMFTTAQKSLPTVPQ
jgi:hypothetical protein